ncbi:programmed cell death protein 5 isoform X3 [Phyllostomus discolor]|uniref:Programmed cell death protein 5 isoform X3 n=1 Tax=Phyllostomus discolor TaxID=89673 RepID=A0A7E6CN06_9CHIR|nr:programmed cell death protein 5 isoform X3 [Phyllostomus discolor]
MAEEELEALRKQRLAELQAKQGDPGDAAQQEAKHSRHLLSNYESVSGLLYCNDSCCHPYSTYCSAVSLQQPSILGNVLISNLALVKPEKTKGVENYLIQMARYGQLSGKFNRRKVMDSDEDDDY